MKQEMDEKEYLKLLSDFQTADNECKTSDIPNFEACVERAEQLRQELSAAPFTLNAEGKVEQKHKYKPSVMDKLNEFVSKHGITIGLSNDKTNAETWEWFEKASGAGRTGFPSVEDAYVAAAAYLKDESGLVLPALDDQEIDLFDSGKPVTKVNAKPRASGPGF